ncbi:MAG: HD domain-containing phosphohydrolase [Bdellovibrionota bacterium]
MKVLLVTDNKDLKELLSLQLSSRLPSTVKECISEAEAAEALRKGTEKFDALICDYQSPDSALLRYVGESKLGIPVILFYDPAGPKPDAGKLPGILLLGTVELNKLVEGIVGLLKPQADKVDPATITEYCPIRTNLLIRVSPLKGDVYIRLSGEKFVKLFQTGDEFDQMDMARYYEEKRVEYMYLRRAETSEFIQKFTNELEQLLKKTDLKPEEALATAEMTQEAVQELVHRVGFTPEVQTLAKKNVELSLKAIGSQPKLSTLINKVIKDGNYLSQHSTLLSHMACCVAKEMDWGSEATFSKLVLASYMHDISLSHPELAKINSLAELETNKANFPAEAVKSYHLHPAKSADVVRSFQEIPPDVDLIVLQHHERPGGGGFPRGLAHNYIAPLSAVFIVAHDLTQEILAQKERFSLPNFILDRKRFFNQGNFKKVMAALEKVKV